MIRSKWSLTVREAPVDRQTILTSILSDGKQAAKDIGDKVQVAIDGARTLYSQLKTFLTYMLSDGKQAAKEIGVKIEDVGQDVGDKLQCVDDKVQVVIDGARGVQSVTKPSNIYSFRRKANKSSGTRNKSGHSTGGQRHGSNQVSVTFSLRHFSELKVEITRREPVDTATTILAVSYRSVHESQHCTKGSSRRNGGLAFSWPDHHQVEVYGVPIMDLRKTYVSVIISGEHRRLTNSDYPSGFWEKRNLVRFSSSPSLSRLILC